LEESTHMSTVCHAEVIPMSKQEGLRILKPLAQPPTIVPKQRNPFLRRKSVFFGTAPQFTFTVHVLTS
jgi:hypothetical protein